MQRLLHLAALVLSTLIASSVAAGGQRARELGVPFDGTPGSFNAITDVRGVEVRQISMLPNDRINPIFVATVQATEEAVVNAMLAAETMTGVDGHTVPALPHAALREALRKYGRLRE